MNLTVRDIQKIWEEGSAALVAGEKGLDKTVDCYNMMEQPEIKPWLRENILMITTGYAIRNDKQALLRLIQDLNDTGAAALAIKTRFFDEFPREALELADALNFPLFFLNNDQGFMEQVFPVMVALVESRNGGTQFERGQGKEKNQKEQDAKLFWELVNGKITETVEIEYWMHSLNWPVAPVRVLVFSVIPGSYAMASHEENMDKIYSCAKMYLASCKVHGQVIMRKKECICIIHDNLEKEKLSEMGRELQRRIIDRFKYEATVGISRAFFDFRELKTAWTDGQDAVRIAGNPAIGKKLVWIEDVLFEQTVLRMSREDYVRKYVQDTLAGLEIYDRDHDSHLEQTLECLIRNMGSKIKAAGELFLHRNTMAYRVKQIENLMNCDLSSADDLMRLGMAVKIKHYMQMDWE